MNSQRIGIVVVNYNSGELLQTCLKALDQQQRRPDRIVVVDNASTDSSKDVVKKLAELDDSVELIELDVNTGFASANNLAVARLDDVDWIVTLNPDTVADSKWLERLEMAANRHTEFDFFGCRMISGDPDVLDGVGDVYHTSGLVWRFGHGLKSREEDLIGREIFSPCAAAAMYRRSQWIEVGGLDESYFCYVEDIDLGFRLRLSGYRCRYVPDAVVTHIGSALSGSHSDFTVYHGHRNLVWTYIKNMPGHLFWIYLPQHILLNLITIAGFVWRGQARTILRSKWHAVKGLPLYLRKRREIQKSRRASVDEIRRVLTRGVKPLARRRYRYG